MPREIHVKDPALVAELRRLHEEQVVLDAGGERFLLLPLGDLEASELGEEERRAIEDAARDDQEPLMTSDQLRSFVFRELEKPS